MLCLMIWNEEAKRMSKYLYRLADGCRVLTNNNFWRIEYENFNTEQNTIN